MHPGKSVDEAMQMVALPIQIFILQPFRMWLELHQVKVTKWASEMDSILASHTHVRLDKPANSEQDLALQWPMCLIVLVVHSFARFMLKPTLRLLGAGRLSSSCKHAIGGVRVCFMTLLQQFHCGRTTSNTL